VTVKEGREAAGISQDVLCRRARVRRWRLALHEQNELALEADELARVWATIRRVLDARVVELEAARRAVAEIEP
jgi:hypothetical protein